jgi:hypothetical protein
MNRGSDHLVQTLLKITPKAIRRLLETGPSATELFNEQEEKQLAEALAAVYGPANLLGAAAIRLREQKAAKGKQAKNFADDAECFVTFGDKPLPPLQPLDALNFFKNLIPSLDMIPERWGALLERKSFTLAAYTNETMLSDVKEAITKGMDTGDSIGYGTEGISGKINKILQQVGITPQNPQYAEMVARTNTMDAYNTGTNQELVKVSDTFPAWKYSAITKDNRGRKWHVEKNGMHFAASIPFAAVRGTEAKDVCNCRCVMIPVDKWDLADYLKNGGKLHSTWNPS